MWWCGVGVNLRRGSLKFMADLRWWKCARRERCRSMTGPGETGWNENVGVQTRASLSESLRVVVSVCSIKQDIYASIVFSSHSIETCFRFC